MKKIIGLSLSIMTIITCGWLIAENLGRLDIASNKADTWVMWEKQEVDERTDIDFCKKQVLKSELDCRRRNDRIKSDIALQTLHTAIFIIIIQLILLVFIALMPKKTKFKQVKKCTYEYFLFCKKYQ
ncbi:hypothetical protein PG357_10250 [Riemerella anatipestifer]|uniref:hypothetical protein n=1 Tax=Riemerella anatipestifer TaxID=34085 RepID=UPI00069A1141|nr:hypothetical protein [Riemerella anatipestifer]MDY3352360.1 hypothetical protein [Riemerella anatipestifer]